MKKSAFSLVALAILAASSLTASGAVSGSNPRPQAVASVSFDGVVQAVLLYFGF